MRNYTIEEVLNKLIKRGINPIYDPNTQALTGLEALIKTDIGNKLWGMIDFLGRPLFRVAKLTKAKKKKWR